MATYYIFGANVGTALDQQNLVTTGTTTSPTVTTDVSITVNESTFQNRKEVLKVIETLRQFLLKGPNLAGQNPIQP